MEKLEEEGEENMECAQCVVCPSLVVGCVERCLGPRGFVGWTRDRHPRTLSFRHSSFPDCFPVEEVLVYPAALQSVREVILSL